MPEIKIKPKTAAKHTKAGPFHERLKEAIGDDDLHELADTLGISKNALSLTIHGRSRPNKQAYEKLVALYPELDGSFDPNKLRNQPVPYTKIGKSKASGRKPSRSGEVSRDLISAVAALHEFRSEHKDVWPAFVRVLERMAALGISTADVASAARGFGGRR